MPAINRTIKLGDLEIARMGLGTNRLTETTGNAQFVREAFQAGIGLIDTAHLYTSGSSERTIGAALNGPGGRRIVATKGGFRPGEGRPEVLAAQIDESLRRLRTTSIDLFYLHRVDPETPLETSLGVLSDYHDRGLIRNVGISHVSVAQIELARQVVPISAVQNQYNVADRGSDDVVDYCTEEHIVFVPYYPLHGDHPLLSEIARGQNATASQIGLAWLLRRSPNILPIPGTLSIEHVRENVGALDIELTDEEFDALSGQMLAS